MTNTIKIHKPNDFHIHLRDGDVLADTATAASRQFGNILVMPNLTPPITSTNLAEQYRQRILNVLPSGTGMNPFMAIYLTDKTSIEEIKSAKNNKHILAAKYYPAGATTNSDAGVTNIKNVYPVLEEMQKQDLVLCLHGEITDPNVDIFDREAKFIDQILIPLVKQFPDLKIALEHITTQQAAEYVEASPDNIAATITIQHLLYNRNHLLSGGIKPHLYCLPILKRNSHQQSLINAALSGNKKFFLGTDSAPHSTNSKESSCGCAGCYSAGSAIELYTEFFDNQNALDKLEGFASIYGANFYNIPISKDTMILVREPNTIPESLSFGNESITPLRAGETINWKIQH